MNPESLPLDLSEKGRKEGKPVSLDCRLFMQFLAFTDCHDTPTIINALNEWQIEGVLYEDVNDPLGIGLLTFSEHPDDFVSGIRSFLQAEPFSKLTPKPEMTMLGRTYTIGYEADLEDTLINKPKSKVLNPDLAWAIWYPLRRVKGFETLPAEEQRKMLGEHGGIGMAFGRAGLATDIRLACHGLDKNDNDFVVALLGRELYPLSAVVQAMRKTKQTAEYLESLGPFFIGKVAWQNG